MEGNYTQEDIENIARELKDKRVTEWLDPQAKCGPSVYDVVTNLHWLQDDAARMIARGIKVAVVHYHYKAANFRIAEGETVEDIVEKLEIAKEEV